MRKCNILNVNIAAVDMPRLISYTENNLEKLRGKYICVANVHTTVTAYENTDYKRAYDNAQLIIPDGGPLSSEARRRGYPEMRRTTGPDYMKEILNRGYTHFFYGSTNETLRKIKGIITREFTDARIAGMISPPFRNLSTGEDSEIIKIINNAEPDFIWVGLGAPKQELWMYNHADKLNGLMVGVGAAFDYLAGNIKRAPEWMQKCNLEWLYRLNQDPKRLFKRYLYTNTKFIWNAVVCRK